MLEAIAQALQSAIKSQNDQYLSAEEIIDTLWLTAQLYVPQAKDLNTEEVSFSDQEISLKVLDSEKRELEPVTHDKPPQSKNFPFKEDIPKPSSKQISEVRTAAPSTTEILQSKSAKLAPFKTPDAPALRHPLLLAQALRPLRCKVLSRTERVLDLPGTIQRIANDNVWLPVERPAPILWLDLMLVIDESRSVGIWQQAIQELQQLLLQLGAFRDVRIWYARSGSEQPLSLYSKHGNHHHHKELVDPQSRRLIWILSDSASTAWYHGKWIPWLQDWGKYNLVALVQLLPSRFWSQTALSAYEQGWVRCSSARLANSQWRFRKRTSWRPKQTDKESGLVLPIIELDGLSLRQWVLALTERSDLEVAGYRVREGEIYTDSSRDLVPTFDQFLAVTSPLARRLAAFMSAAPVQLPIVRLIQQTLLPQSNTTHVAEVFLSGILECVVDAEHPDERLYQFRADFRKRLNYTLLKQESVRVIQKISEYIAMRVGRSSKDFRAVLLLKPDEFPTEIRASGEVFARLALEVLERYGQSYQQLIDQIKSNLTVSEERSEERFHGVGELENEIYSSTYADSSTRVAQLWIRISHEVLSSFEKQFNMEQLVNQDMSRLLNRMESVKKEWRDKEGWLPETAEVAILKQQSTTILNPTIINENFWERSEENQNNIRK